MIGDLVVFEKEHETLQILLAEMATQMGSDLICLVGKHGQLIASAGNLPCVDLVTLASLSSASVSTSAALTALFGQSAYRFSYHENDEKRLLMIVFENAAVLVVFFEKAKPFGFVRHQISKFEKEILYLVSQMVSSKAWDEDSIQKRDDDFFRQASFRYK